ncbi:MAG: 2-hydroxychromene-2-carboxylate isomerase [Betaproteobacteria bacterium]|nr:2-hydroxychromene-2-carboxylate isomerase [Betaproteobacteria bacterium]
MTVEIEFFFDVGSPASYLAYTQLPGLAADTGATIRWRPMLLGGVFKATGNASPVTVAAKGRWLLGDLALWASRYGVTLNMNPAFPINTLGLMRGATGFQLRRPDDFGRYLDAVFGAMWCNRRDLGDPAEVAATLSAAGIDPATYTALIEDPAIKSALAATTQEAVDRGVFGAPTFFVDGRMFFGQDRLEFVRECVASCTR